MKRTQNVIILTLVMAAASVGSVYAQDTDPAGRLALRWSLGPTFVLANSDLRDESRIGPAVNASVLWDPLTRLGVFFAYDRLDAGRSLESETMTGGLRAAYRLDSALRPFLEAGAGVGRRDVGEGFKKLAIRANAGLSCMLTPRISMGAMASYHFIETQSATSGDMHAVVPSVFTAYHFGPNPI